jgi:hypothetical protein
MAAYARHGRQRSARATSSLMLDTPNAWRSRRSDAGNASGHCRARATIAVASRPVTPSTLTSVRCVASTSLPGSKRSDPSTTNPAICTIAWASAAQQEADGNLEAVKGAWHAETGEVGHAFAESALLEVRVDRGRFSVEVEQVSQARQEWHQRWQQRRRDVDRQVRRRLTTRSRQDALHEHDAGAIADSDRARILSRVDELDSRHGALPHVSCIWSSESRRCRLPSGWLPTGRSPQLPNTGDECDRRAAPLVWQAMSSTSSIAKRALWRSVVAGAAAATIACSDNPTTGLGTPLVATPRNTVPGTGQLAELEQRRADWLARGITDYRFQLRITCFCGGDITRPVLIEVRRGAVTKVWDLETGRSISATSNYPTITALFDSAIAEQRDPRRGGRVRVTYDAALGIPVFLEVGTLENDAGVGYQVGGLVQI